MSAASDARKQLKKEQKLEKLRAEKAAIDAKVAAAIEGSSTGKTKKSLKKGLGLGCLGTSIAFGIVIILMLIFGTDETAPKASFTGHIVSARVLNPASVNVKFSVTNNGKVAGVPNCSVSVQDPSGAYHGKDYPILKSLEPGKTWTGNMNLIVTGQGAAYVTEASISC